MRYIILLLSILSSLYTNAQSISIGVGLHHNINGIHLLYAPNKSLDAQWQWQTGLRIAVNNLKLNVSEDKIPGTYQTGYASGLWQHLALTSNLSKKIVGGRNWRLDGMLGATLSRNGIEFMYRSYVLGVPDKYYDIYYKEEPRINLEVGLGLKAAFKVSEQVQLHAYTLANLHTLREGHFSMMSADIYPTSISIMGIGLRYQFKSRNDKDATTPKIGE